MSETWFLRCAGAVGLALIFFPGIDLGFSRLFFMPGFTDPSRSFIWRGLPLVDKIHEAVVSGSFSLAALFGAGLLCAAAMRRPILGLGTMQWLFLATALAVGPGLMVNTVFKENWERARPVQIEEFGGRARFAPPLVVSHQCHHNCSFVSGEASFGFFLSVFAYIAKRRQRAIFVAGMAAGLLIGLMRIGQGAHFLSDVLYAGAFTVATNAATHAAFYGRNATATWWRTHISLAPQ